MVDVVLVFATANALRVVAGRVRGAYLSSPAQANRRVLGLLLLLFLVGGVVELGVIGTLVAMAFVVVRWCPGVRFVSRSAARV